MTLCDIDWESFAANIGVPKRFRAASFEAGTSTATLKQTQDWMSTDYPAGGCLVLAGMTGVGKTYAAVAALRESTTVADTRLISEPRQFFYFPAACGRLLVPETREETLRLLTKCPFVVLDDLGLEYIKEGGLLSAFLDEIVWYREANFKATIITTNLTTDALKARLPDRLADRLRGDWGVVFECPGESLRPSVPKRVSAPPPPRPEPGPSEYIDVTKAVALLKTRTR